jgi:hypothetical protein
LDCAGVLYWDGRVGADLAGNISAVKARPNRSKDLCNVRVVLAANSLSKIYRQFLQALPGTLIISQSRKRKAYPCLMQAIRTRKHTHSTLGTRDLLGKTRQLFARSVAFALNAKFFAKQMQLIIQGGNRVARRFLSFL